MPKDSLQFDGSRITVFRGATSHLRRPQCAWLFSGKKELKPMNRDGVVKPADASEHESIFQ